MTIKIIIYILYQSPCFIYLQIISDNFDVLILSTWFIKCEWVGRKHWVRVLALSENNCMMTLDKLLNIWRLHCLFCKMSGRIHWMISKGPVVWVWNFASLESTHHLQHHGRKLLSGSLPRFANQTALSITCSTPSPVDSKNCLGNWQQLWIWRPVLLPHPGCASFLGIPARLVLNRRAVPVALIVPRPTGKG